MSDEDRAKEIVGAVEHLLKPGEAWIVRRSEDNEIEAVPEGKASLASTNPELYGRLLTISEQLSSAGGALCIWGPVLVLVLCLGVHLDWFESVLGENAKKFQSFWLYGLAFVIAFFLFGGVAKWWERMKYKQYRDGVLTALDHAKVTPHRLIADIEGDEALEHLADQMKEDPQIV